RLKDEIGETISAFSNSDGGAVIVGVSNKNHAYKRVGKTNQMISTSEIRRLAREEKRRLSWGEQICEKASLEDIEEDKVKWFLRRAKEERGLAIEEDTKIYDILTKLNLLQDNKLANAAILLFGKDPEHFFMQSEVKCIALPTTEFVKPYDTYQTYGGNLFEQMDKATTFTLENIKFIRQKGRIQRSEYVELCNCSPKTAYNDIQDLIKKNILIASGKGKRTYYMLRGFYIKAGGM
ncbi:MAG TPA: hypothetical protein C5S37_10775, partial [Methanophagales archaeon]|nr:hypothetical protein [Methanophagales archaeon]